jgi:hypothetical protein
MTATIKTLECLTNNKPKPETHKSEEKEEEKGKTILVSRPRIEGKDYREESSETEGV